MSDRVSTNQFTVKNGVEPKSTDAAEFGAAAGAEAILNIPKTGEVLAAPNGGIVYAPAGATQKEREKAALAFAENMLGKSSVENVDRQFSSGNLDWRTQSVFSDPDLLSQAGSLYKKSETLRESNPAEFSALRDQGDEIYKKNQTFKETTIKNVAATDGNASNLTVPELAAYILTIDADKNGVIQNTESRKIETKPGTGGGSVIT